MKSKIIALYLPQFHRIPENDEFWGEGFTDWVTVKNAKPLYKGHAQPRVPLDNNYYDLSEEASVMWQANLARENGIYGFGVYHYWFNNEKNLLTKPAEIMRDSNNLGVKYFFIWDNCSWKRSWSNVEGNDWAPTADESCSHKGPSILIEYILGEEKDWENHYQFVKRHFDSPNYEKMDNKPMFGLLNYDENVGRMCEYWNDRAKSDGYEGIVFVFKDCRNVPEHYYKYRYEPHDSSWWGPDSFSLRIKRRVCRVVGKEYRQFKYCYDSIWKNIINNAKKTDNSHVFFGAFVGYDDTPRRGRAKGKIVSADSVSKFFDYFKELYKISLNKKKPYLFLTAWNEWGEGAYIEPDSVHKYDFLKAIQKVSQIEEV